MSIRTIHAYKQIYIYCFLLFGWAARQAWFVGLRLSCFWHARFLPPLRVCWGGWGYLHAEMSNPMVFTVLSTHADCSCVLVFRADPCWNMSICMVFARQEANNTVFTVFLLVFRRHFLRAGPILWCLPYYLHLFTAPARCVYLCFCASRAENHDFYGVLAGFEKAICPAGHLSSAALFSCLVSACYFDIVGWDASSKTSLNHKPSLQDLKPKPYVIVLPFASFWLRLLLTFLVVLRAFPHLC